MNIKNDFKIVKIFWETKEFVVLPNKTFDFQNSAIFAFIHDKNKRRIIEACFIAYHNTTEQWQGFFFQNITIYR